MTKKKVLFGVGYAIVVSVVLLVVCGNPFASPGTSLPSTSVPRAEDSPAEETSPVTTPAEPEDTEPEATLPPMTTYTSSYYGVAIDYPEGWRAKTSSYQGVPYSIDLSHPGLIVQMGISTWDREFQQKVKVFTPQEYINWVLANWGGSTMDLLAKPATTTIQGYEACTVALVARSTGHWYRYIAVKKGDLLYTIRGLTQDPLYQPEIEAMLDSFRFIP